MPLRFKTGKKRIVRKLVKMATRFGAKPYRWGKGWKQPAAPKQISINNAYGRVSNLPGISNECYTKHAYTQLYSFQAGAGGTFGVEQTWRLNSLFDPDETAAGHQPYLRDTYAALYNKYKVMACKMEVLCSDPTADGLVVANAIRTPGDTTTLVGTTPTVAGERPNVSLKYVNNTGKQITIFKKYVKMSSVSGLSKLQFHADPLTYAANSGANPSATPFLTTAIAALDGSSTPSLRITFKFTFYTKWYDRIIQAQS